ncbi:MAG: hypothetical protein ACQGVC_18865 [Myxococcota bacterium]
MARAAEKGRARASTPDQGATSFSPVEYLLLYGAYLGALLLVYQPALSGDFISDDLHYVLNNVYVHTLSLENVLAILEPYGGSTIAVVNYAPVQMLLHSLAWQLFGPEVLGHHVLNLLFHAAGSLLLVPLFVRSGLPRAAALMGSALFLLHPANVEAVAWISQLKTNSALCLGLLAVLAHPRRPALALLLFALALLAKPNAAVALPIAAWLEWSREGRLRKPWWIAWALVFAVFAVVEFTAHQRSGVAETTLYDHPLVLLRTMAGLATRYAVLGYTSYGTSAFHETEPAWSWLDPWWLASLPLLGVLAWRLVSTLRGRRPEAAWWLCALVSFGPVSQIFPFLFPFADRYLYFILPGLLGGALLAGRDAMEALPALRARREWLARAALAGAVLLAVVFAFRSHERAGIWRSAAFVTADAAKHYPDGVSASLQRARAAALVRDADTAVAEIRHAMGRGYNRFEQLLQDPGFEPIRHTAAFQGVLRDTAQVWIDAAKDWDSPTQIELHRIASAHVVRGEIPEAIALLRRALAQGGPIDETVRNDLAALGAL